jgi:hypothetical protein
MEVQRCDKDGESGSVITRAASVSHYKAKKWGMRVVGYERRKDHPDIASNWRVTVLLYCRPVQFIAFGH